MTADSRAVTFEQRPQWRRAVAGADLPAGQRLVLLMLETFADYRDGTNAHPGEANLAGLCRVDVRTVRRALARGEQLALIARTANPRRRRSGGLSTVYRICFPPGITGQHRPVDDDMTGQCGPVDNRVDRTALSTLTGQHCPPTYPGPNHSSELRNGGTSPGPPRGSTHSEEIPSRFCDLHPQGTRRKCGDCGNARTAFNAAIARTAAAKAVGADELEGKRRQREWAAKHCTRCDGRGVYEIGDDLVAKCDPHVAPPEAVLSHGW